MMHPLLPKTQELIVRIATRAVLFDPECQTSSMVDYNSAVACVNYLFSLGHQDCVVNGDVSQFCRAGNAVIYGSNIQGGGPVSSY